MAEKCLCPECGSEVLVRNKKLCPHNNTGGKTCPAAGWSSSAYALKKQGQLLAVKRNYDEAQQIATLRIRTKFSVSAVPRRK